MKIKNLQAYKHMRNARASLCFHKTYFGAALWALKLVEVEDLIKKAGSPLAADMHWRVYYDPEFVMQCKLNVVMAGLLHELGHLVRGHFERGSAMGIQPINHKPWNIAGDLELNDDLEKDPEVNMKGLPWDYITPAKMKPVLPDGKMAEWYYHQLPVQNVGKEGQDGNGLPNTGDCGSCSHGIPKEWESKGDSEGVDKIGKAEGKLIQAHTADAVKNHVAKNRGSVPAGWERWAESFGQPVVNWRRQLAALVRNRLASVYGNFDYSFQKPNRRQSLYGDLIMPAMIQPVPKLATVVDTSGSMSQEDLKMCMAEIKGILQAVGIGEVTNYACDAEAHDGVKVQKVQDIVLKGGGGTDMRVGIAKACEDQPDLDVVIVLTDGYTPWPQEGDNRAKVIAVLTQDSCMHEVPPHIKAVCVA